MPETDSCHIRSNSFQDVFQWFSRKPSKLGLGQRSICEKLSQYLTKNCILVPGHNETRAWYEPARELFCYTKSFDCLACAHGMVIGISPYSNTTANHDECQAIMLFPETNDYHSSEHKHGAFGLKEAYQLCYGWAVELMSCAVGDPSWLAVGVGAVSSFVPKGMIPSSTQDQMSQVERALLLAQKRNAEEKKRYLATYSAENFHRLCTAVHSSSVFKGVDLEGHARWESFGQVVHDLVTGALKWRFVPLIEEVDRLPSLHPTAQDTPVMTEKPSCSAGVDGQNNTDGDDDAVLHPELSREISTGIPAKPVKANQEPAKGFPVTASADGRSAKKRRAPLDEIDDEKVIQTACIVNRVASRTTKRNPSRLRRASATRPTASRNENKKVSLSQEVSEVSPAVQGNSHRVPDTMLPIVVIHRLPRALLEELDKENSNLKTGLQCVRETVKVKRKKRATSSIRGVVRRAKSTQMKPLVVKLFNGGHSSALVEIASRECSTSERNSSLRYRTRSGSVSSTGTLSSAFSQETRCSDL